MGTRTTRFDPNRFIGHQAPSANLWPVSPQKDLVNPPQDIPEDFEDEELAQYAEEFTKGELDEAADEYFDLSDWDGIDDATFAAALEDQEMQM